MDDERSTWTALTERDRLGDEILRRRLAAAEERLQRLALQEAELAQRAANLDRLQAEAGEAKRATA
ncbi:MAG: hypothetical protein ACRDLK_06760, partial [Gaiellaceae bacterium]